MDFILAAILTVLIVGPHEARMFVLKWIGVIILTFVLLYLFCAIPAVVIIIGVLYLVFGLRAKE